MNSLINFIEPEFEHTDDRGSLVQLFSRGWKQVNVVRSEKGSFRGEHYHKNNIEFFYVVSGSFRLLLDKSDEHEEYVIKSGSMFTVEPNVIHTFDYLEDSIVIAAYDNGIIEAEGKDIYSKNSSD